MDELEETALVRRLAGMDEEAWEGFCKEYAPPLGQFLQLRFGCAAERAEEILQMAFLRCVRSIGRFDPARGRLLPWLKTIVANEARTCLGRDSRHPAAVPLSSIPDPSLAPMASLIDQQPLPDQILARQDTCLLIQECLLEINTRQRQVLVRKYAQEQSVAQIAQELNLSAKAVESLLSRGRESFRAVLLAKLTGQNVPVAEILR